MDVSAPSKFKQSAEELFWRLIKTAMSAGEGTDQQRALTYLAVRYDAIYTRVTEAHASNFSSSAINARCEGRVIETKKEQALPPQ